MELHQWEAADGAFEAAQGTLLSLNLPNSAIEALGGLARSALAQGLAAKATAFAELIHEHWLREGNFTGTERPWELCLACCDVLGPSDTRSLALARHAWDGVSAQARQLPESARDTFWQAHTAHRRLQLQAEQMNWG